MSISQTVIRRLPLYLHYLKLLPPDIQNVSATTIASALELGDVQVRKDLAIVSGAGRPKIGYAKTDLISAIEDSLGYKDKKLAVIVGAGKLGTAFLEFDGFDEYGLNIVAGFDTDLTKIGYTDMGKYVYPMDDFREFCSMEKIMIGIITVPSSSAQSVCDIMVDSGITAIWNFAQTKLTAPNGILVQNENLASSLALLSSHLAQ